LIESESGARNTPVSVGLESPFCSGKARFVFASGWSDSLLEYDYEARFRIQGCVIFVGNRGQRVPMMDDETPIDPRMPKIEFV
jgi:hypothetical protein